MMTSFAKISWASLALVFLLASPSLAQGMPGGGMGGPPGGGMGGPPGGGRGGPLGMRGPRGDGDEAARFDPSKTESLQGEIASLGVLDMRGRRYSTFELKTAGETLTVVLGPVAPGPPPEGAPPSEITVPTPEPSHGTPLAGGEPVAVKGCRTRYREVPVLLASEVTVRGEVRRYRDVETGRLLGLEGRGPMGDPGDGPGPRPDGGFRGMLAAPEALYLRVRSAWGVPEEEARAYLDGAKEPLSLETFSVAVMMRHYSEKPLGEMDALRRSKGGWTPVVKGLSGTFAATVFQGNERYPLAAPTIEETNDEPARWETRIRDLARVMTAERLTGRGPDAIRRDYAEGKSLQSLLEPSAGRAAPAGRRDGAVAGPGGGQQRPRGGRAMGGGPPR